MMDRRDNGHSRGDVLSLAATALACLLLPLIAAVLAGGEWARYLQIPPRPYEGMPSGFGWAAFAAIAAAEIAVLAPFVLRLFRRRRAPAPGRGTAPWPWWGSAGLALLAVSWFVAWQEMPRLQALRPHAFTPLWLGYILVVNALLQARTGAAPLSRSPGRFLALFPLSTVFWWLFEYLNQFVGNWYYLGTTTDGPWHYLGAASLPFSTVLPAVFSTWALLASFPSLQGGLDRAWQLPGGRRAWGLAACAAGIAGLLGIGSLPRWTFPMLWVAPVLVLIGIQLLRGRPSVLDAPLAGDWRGLWLAAMAGLVCGFFWELWNAGALARWAYSVPLVHGLELFRMPLLGYGGYLPFGIECLACVQALFGRHFTGRWLPAVPSPASDAGHNRN